MARDIEIMSGSMPSTASAGNNAGLIHQHAGFVACGEHEIGWFQRCEFCFGDIQRDLILLPTISGQCDSL